MNNQVELLAPAGDYESFLAAVENGADAVYLGGKLFNARGNANNFDLEELKKIVEYAYLRNVKIYLTMNTLLNNEELPEALKFAYEIYKIGISAVIVQDLGLAKMLQQYIPDLPLHASTQMTIYNLEGVKELEKLGFRRVVLARELNMDEITYICENTSLEIEVFIHGALCVSYSGQCLMSSMIGDRSGNRGKCAQPCRLPYELIENTTSIEKGYLLSPKDLCTLDLLSQYPNVKSLKIEGRMKSPEYVATVVKTYRKYIDQITQGNSPSVEENDRYELTQIFNRGGFSTAYLAGKQGRSMMCYEKPKNWGIYIGKVTSYDGYRYITLDSKDNLQIGDGIEIWSNQKNSPSTIISEIEGEKIGRVRGNIAIGDKVYKTSDKQLNQMARETFSRGFVKRSDVTMTVTIHADSFISGTINQVPFITDILPQMAQNQPITKEKVMMQLSKSGDTPFRITAIHLDLEDGLFLPIRTLNEVRRFALEQYEISLRKQIPKQIDEKPFENIFPRTSTQVEKNITVFLQNVKPEHLAIRNVNSFYFTFQDVLSQIELIRQFKGKKYIVFPPITKGNYDFLIRKKLRSLASDFQGIVVSNLGQLDYIKGMDFEIIANENFNLFNNYAVNALKDFGIQTVTLSPELTQEQINQIATDLKRELVVYGRQCVMTSEYCPIGSILGHKKNDSTMLSVSTNYSAKGKELSSKNESCDKIIMPNPKCSMPCQTGKKYYLRDRMNYDFPVFSDPIDCRSQIYNCKITSITSQDLKVDSIRLNFQDEAISDINAIIIVHKSGNKMEGNEYTNGHFSRPV